MKPVFFAHQLLKEFITRLFWHVPSGRFPLTLFFLLHHHFFFTLSKSLALWLDLDSRNVFPSFSHNPPGGDMAISELDREAVSAAPMG